MDSVLVTIKHWVPIITYCPVNNLPDLIYVSITFQDKFVELYEARKVLRKIASGKKLFMEDIAKLVADEFPDAQEVAVRLLFNRHIVKVKKRRI